MNGSSLNPPTPQTIREYRSTLSSLIEHKKRIKFMAERYPVYLKVVDQVFRFDAPEDVDSFVNELQSVFRLKTA